MSNLISKLIFLLLLSSCKAVDPNCELSTHFASYIKHYSICQSGDKVTLQIKEGDDQVKFCLIPIYIQKETNKSIFIGEPRCQFISKAKGIHKFKLLKNRPTPSGSISYAKFPIKGVMIVKDELVEFGYPFDSPLPVPNAYLKCAQMLDTTGDKSYCSAFKEKGLYTLHKF